MHIKKIFIVINNPWYAYSFRLNLARAFQTLEYRVYFLMPLDGYYSKLIAQEFEILPIDVDANGLNPLSDLKLLWSLYRIYREVKPEAVLNFTIKPNIYSSMVARWLKIKAISNITGLGTVFIKQTFITQIVKVLYRYALKYNATVFFQNQDDCSLFRKLNLVCEKQVHILPGSGVDLKKFVPYSSKKDDKKFLFLMVARLLKDKGIVEYVEAMKRLKEKYPSVEGWLVGELGAQNMSAITQDELDTWVNNNLVTYLGKRDDIPYILSMIDCVVLPSYREGMPRSLLEAAAMEKPIVTTNVPGCKSVVTHGANGYLCEVKSVDDLFVKMEQMFLLSYQEREKMGKNGRNKIVHMFDEKIVIEKYIQKVCNTV